VFPSRTDTFGLVMLESMACGTPVAAFKAPGPLDVVPAHAGVLGDDLRLAAMQALTLDRAACRAHAEQRSWRDCSALFLHHLVSIRDSVPATAKAA
jgi:glycosyltransferase involved in cell wall biosynthesis